MSKMEWGQKHICSDCSTKFYDLSKPIPECPKCGSQVVISRKPRVGRPPLSKKQPKVVPAKKVTVIMNQEDIAKTAKNEEVPVENVDTVQEIENIEEIEDIEEIEEIEGIEEIEEIENIDEDMDPIKKVSDPALTDKIETNEN